MSFLIDPYALEEDFPERILDRGSSYWASGTIAQLSQDGSGVWRATVVGSRNYRVTVMPTDDEMVVCGCTCPYAADAPCKHIAAVLLELDDLEIERELNFDADDLSEDDPDSEIESFEALLKQADKETLMEFIRSICWSDPLIHHKFMASMIPLRFQRSQTGLSSSVRGVCKIKHVMFTSDTRKQITSCAGKIGIKIIVFAK